MQADVARVCEKAVLCEYNFTAGAALRSSTLSPGSERSAPPARSTFDARVPSSVVIVVVVVLEVRRVSVDESVAFVEAIKHPEPAQPTETVRPRLVERAGLMQGKPLVRHARALACCER